MEPNIKIGDKIRYTSALGRHTALVKAVRVAPAADTSDSIPWLDIEVLGFRHHMQVSIPADEKSLKIYNVEIV